MMDGVIYAKPYLANSRRAEVLVKEKGRTKLLFFEANQEVWQDPLLNDDFALVALCQYCAARGKDLFIEGKITKSALSHMEEFIQIWSVWKPNLFSRIKMDAASIVDDIPNRELPAVLAFSGGVDAAFSLAIHKSKGLGWLNREIKLGVMIIGYDLKEEDPDAVANAYRAIHSILNDSYDIPAIAVKTNWMQEFCPDWLMGFNVGVTSILHLFTSHYAAGIFSSDFNYLQELELEPYGSHMVVNHLLGSFTFPIISTGGTHTRLQKIQFLKEFPDLVGRLRVCWQNNSNGRNCGECEKCDRTRLELIQSGIDRDIFNKPYDEERLRNRTITTKPQLMFYEDVLLSAEEGSIVHAIAKEILDREAKKFDPSFDINRQLRSKDKEIEHLNALIIKKTNELNDVFESKSWRVTRPIRWVIRKVKQLSMLAKP